MIKIIIHTFPHELMEYKRVITQLNNTTAPVGNIQIISCLNINEQVCVINKHDLATALDTFRHTNLHSKIKINSTVESDINFYGINEHRRRCINESSDTDILIYIDPDLHFHPSLLKTTLDNSAKIHNQQDYFIITPQCVRLWDTTWDCLVNRYFIRKPLHFCNEVDPIQISSNTYGELDLVKLDTFKWAGGWFTCTSSKLAKLIGIPNKFIGYGPDDTFVMEGCKHLKKIGINVSQFIQTGYVVCEDRTLIEKNKCFLQNNINFRKQCNNIFFDELSFFKKRIQSDIYNNNAS